MSNLDRLSAALSGRYQVERELGEGGMATVYLAQDLKHNRKVALKVLKPELAAVVGAERFLAEIETTANLQHPNILPLYDSGEAESFLYYVMPYVEGESLRDRLDAEKQLPVEEAVRIATAVANALDFAHGHGVVHRDIKPGNILFQGGQPVVGDFGIALALGAGGGARLTETGLSVGTPYYMSPEQATGDQDVGARSDIYSLGCVLYEMLVGDPPYLGSTAQAVLGQIITGKPVTAAEKRSAVPPHVDAAIRKALEKVPADRFETAGAFADALGNPAFRHGTGIGGTVGGGSAWPWMTATAIAVALAVVSFGWAVVQRRGEAPGVTAHYRLEAPAPVDRIAGDDFLGVAFSPDGSSLVWALRDSTDNHASSHLWIQRWDGLPLTELPGTEGAYAPSFSPNSRSIGFMVGRDLKVLDLDEGRPRTIQANADFAETSWGDDGFIYGAFDITPKPTIVRVPEGGGEPEEVTQPPGPSGTVRTDQVPSSLPGGRGLLFTKEFYFNPGADSVCVVDLKTHQQRALLRGRHAWYSPSGDLVYLVDDRLMVAPFDLETLEPTGPSRVIMEKVAEFVASDRGSLYYFEGTPRRSEPELVWVRHDGTEHVVDWHFDPGPLPEDPVFSPDGSRLAVAVWEDSLPIVYVRNLEDGTTTRLGPGWRLAWSADGKEIGFIGPPREGEKGWRLYRRRADGSAPPVPVTGAPDRDTLTRDIGRWSLDQPIVGETSDGLDVFQRDDSVPHGILQGVGPYENPTLSPDGRWVAFSTPVSGEWKIFARPYPDVRAGLYPVSVGEGTDPQWSRDGRTLYYAGPLGTDGPRDIIAAHLQTEDGFAVVKREILVPFQRGYHWGTGGWLFTVAPDGAETLISRWKLEPPVVTGHVLVEDFAGELRRSRGADEGEGGQP